MTTVPYHRAFVLIVCNAHGNSIAHRVAKCSEKLTYEEQLDERIAAKHVAEAKERGIPLWILDSFSATSSERDCDDPIAFEEG